MNKPLFHISVSSVFQKKDTQSLCHTFMVSAKLKELKTEIAII